MLADLIAIVLAATAAAWFAVSVAGLLLVELVSRLLTGTSLRPELSSLEVVPMR